MQGYRTVPDLRCALGAASGKLCKLNLPTARWFFELSRKVTVLECSPRATATALPVVRLAEHGACVCSSGSVVLVRFSRGARSPRSRCAGSSASSRSSAATTRSCCSSAWPGSRRSIRCWSARRRWSVQPRRQVVVPGVLARRSRRAGLRPGGRCGRAPPNYRELKDELREGGRRRPGDAAAVALRPHRRHHPGGRRAARRSARTAWRWPAAQPFYGLAARVYRRAARRGDPPPLPLRNGLKHGRVDGWDRDAQPGLRARNTSTGDAGAGLGEMERGGRRWRTSSRSTAERSTARCTSRPRRRP